VAITVAVGAPALACSTGTGRGLGAVPARWVPMGDRARSFVEVVGTVDAVSAARAFADVLVVDDDDSVRASMAAVLESAGLHVVDATDGQSAMDVLEHTRVGVLVLDLLMAPRDGVWLLERLARIPPSPPAVIVVSAFALYDRDALMARFSGLVAHALQKPVAPAVLIDRVCATLGRRSP